jgi:hypothetical protein
MASDELCRWEIYVLRHEALYLGTVEAPDSNAAIGAAIKEFEVAERDQKKLFARRVD